MASDSNKASLDVNAKPPDSAQSAGTGASQLHAEDMETPESGLSTAEAQRRFERDGPNMLPEKKVNPCLNFLKYFWGPMPCCIWVAIIIEGVRQDWIDFGVLDLLQFLNGFLAWYEERNAGNAIAALKQKLAPKAVTKRDGEWKTLDAISLVVGDRVKIKLGDIIAADSRLGPGFLEVDQSALTGESLPVTKYEGDEVYQGSICKRGDLEAIVSATGANTFFGKTSSLMSSVDQQGNFQKIIFKITVFLMLLSFVLVITIFGVVLGRGNDILMTLSICVVILVASIPITMQIVCTTTLAIGARQLAKKKAIVSRLNSIEELAGMQILCSDKTGTLTKNILTVQTPRTLGGHSEEEVFMAASLASKRNTGNQDAIDKCITDVSTGKYNLKFDEFEETDFIPFDPKIKRTEATVRNKTTGEVFKVTKGAPQVIISMSVDQALEEDVTHIVQELAAGGYRTIGVAQTISEKWNLLGLIPLYDPPRDDTAETIQKAQDMDIKVKMITGDQIAIAKETARLLKLGDRIYNSDILNDSNVISEEVFDEFLINSDGFAEVFPEHKFAIVKLLQERNFRVGMTGDGVNDAPALKKADVGIAVEGATDAARAAADIVLTSPGLSIIIEALYRSRKIFQRMKFYLIYRIACTLQLLIFFFVVMVGLDPTKYTCFSGGQPCTGVPNTFSIPVIGLVLITFLNDGTIVSIAYDRVKVSKSPDVWNLVVVFVIAIILGMIAFFGSLALMLFGLDNMDERHPDAFLSGFGLSTWTYGELLTVMWLKVSLQDYLTLFSGRCHHFFFERRPSQVVLWASVCAMTTSTFFAVYWFLNLNAATGDTGSIPSMQPIGWRSVGFIWGFDIFWFIVQDIVKVLSYKVFENYYHYKDPAKPLYSGKFLGDSFLVFHSSASDREEAKPISTRDVLESVKITD